MKKLMISSILMAAGFLIIVVLYGVGKNIFSEPSVHTDTPYSPRQVILGGLGETLRAFLTSWLYQYHNRNKSIFTHAVQFGIVCSALIGSIWLCIGVELIDPKDQLSFILDDGIILFLQGFISGVILWLIYRKEDIPVLKNA